MPELNNRKFFVSEMEISALFIVEKPHAPRMRLFLSPDCKYLLRLYPEHVNPYICIKGRSSLRFDPGRPESIMKDVMG